MIACFVPYVNSFYIYVSFCILCLIHIAQKRFCFVPYILVNLHIDLCLTLCYYIYNIRNTKGAWVEQKVAGIKAKEAENAEILATLEAM